jgi:hypothetical protein
MPRRKKNTPVAEIAAQVEPQPPVTDPVGDFEKELNQQARAKAEAAKPKPVERPKRREFERYPEASQLPADDLLHTIEPKPFRSLITDAIPGGLAHHVDTGQQVGERLEFSSPEQRPSEAVKEILKGRRGNHSGLHYSGQQKEWKRQVNGQNPVGTRLEEEGRHAEVVRKSREEAEERGR